MARAPESVGDLVSPGRWGVLDEPLEAIGEPERGGLPQVGAGPELNEPGSRAPLADRDGIGEGTPAVDHRPWRLDVRARLDQRVEHLDVVTAGGPMQPPFGVRTTERGVDVRARRDKRGHDRATVGKVARPVGEHMQRGALVATS